MINSGREWDWMDDIIEDITKFIQVTEKNIIR